MSAPNRDPVYLSITPDQVAEWIAALERGGAWRGFLGQLVASHRKLYEQVHGAEPAPARQLELFGP